MNTHPQTKAMISSQNSTLGWIQLEFHSSRKCFTIYYRSPWKFHHKFNRKLNRSKNCKFLWSITDKSIFKFNHELYHEHISPYVPKAHAQQTAGYPKRNSITGCVLFQFDNAPYKLFYNLPPIYPHYRSTTGWTTPDVQHINILSPPIRLHTITYAYRCDARTMLQPFVAHWLAHVRTPANVRVKIDVNPQNFM